MKVLVCGGRDYSADEKEAATVKPDLTVGVEVVPVKAVAVMGVRPAPAQASSSIGPALADLRTLAEAATPGPWQVVTYRTPFAVTRYDGTTCSGEHVGRDIATVRHHPQSHAPVPIVTLGIGVTQETPVPFVFIRPEDADYLAAVSPEVVLALLDTIDALRASLAAAEKERDEALRDAIEFTQKVDAGIVRDEEYLRLHREKMEQYDRRVAAEARAEKAEAAQYNEAQAECEALKRENAERKLSELQAAHEALQQAHQDAVQQLASRNNEIANLRKLIGWQGC